MQRFQGDLRRITAWGVNAVLKTIYASRVNYGPGGGMVTCFSHWKVGTVPPIAAPALLLALGLSGCAGSAPRSAAVSGNPSFRGADVPLDKMHGGWKADELDRWLAVQHPREDKGKGKEGAGGSGGADRNLDLLPLISFLRAHVPDAHVPAVGSYTRLYADGEENTFDDVASTGGSRAPKPHAERRRYSDEHRQWFRRWALGRSTSRVLTVQATLSYPPISVTVPLASASFASNRKDGESWNTEINPSRFLTPYFRVASNATLSLRADLQASSRLEGAITANVVDVLQRASALIAPQAKLVTMLNSDRINAAASYMDQSISALFGESITERSTQDFAPPEWSQAGIATLLARFPTGVQLYDDELAGIGAWRIKASSPIASIFVESPLCDSECISVEAAAAAAFRKLSPYAVLNFALSSDTTVIQLLRSLDGFTELVAALNAAAPERAMQAAARESSARLCALVSTEADRQGFNAPDVAAVVWALSRSGLLNGEGAALLLDGGTCEAARLWESLETQAGEQGG